MQIEVPYQKDKINIDVDDNRVAGIITGNEVTISDEDATLRHGIENPINSQSLKDFLKDTTDILFIVNDATRPTPTSRILDSVFKIIKPANPKFLVATGTHPAPTQEEYTMIFGPYYEKYKSCIFAHDCHDDKEMVYLGRSRNGTSLSINRLVLEASKIIVISSVEPHYFAGYTGGRKSLFPGVAAFKSIEQNHKFAMEPGAKALALEGNPVHEDMVDAIEFLKNKEMFAIMTVLDKDHRIFATTSGNINDSFYAAVKEAEKVFVVKIKEKVDIVVTVARFPMDINLYQSQKAVDNGKLALRDGGVLILVSSCRMGIGDKSFIELLSSCNSPTDVFDRIKESYQFGAHKAAKLAEINLWAEMYGVTGLTDDVLKSVFIKPFPSLQDAIDSALKKKGEQAKILFLLDGSLTVPIFD